MDHQPFQTGVWALPPTDCHRAHQLAHCHDERHLPGLAIFSICIFLGENLVPLGEIFREDSSSSQSVSSWFKETFSCEKPNRRKSLTILGTCQRIQQDSDTEWKFGLAKLIRNMHRTNASPSPINLVTTWTSYLINKCKSKLACYKG